MELMPTQVVAGKVGSLVSTVVLMVAEEETQDLMEPPVVAVVAVQPLWWSSMERSM